MIFNLQDTPQKNRYFLSDDEKYRFQTFQDALIEIYVDPDTGNDWYIFRGNRISFFESSNYSAGFTVQYSTISSRTISDLVSDIEAECPNFFQLYNYPVLISNQYRITVKIPAPDTFVMNNNDEIYVRIFNAFVGDDFSTNLYQELLDNSEQFQLAKSFLNDTDPSKQLDPSYWTDTQLKFFDFVEKYNKNVISLRSTKKVNANVSGSISQSSEQQQIDLSPITNQLLNLNSKFEITKQDPNNNISYTENITKVLDDKQDTKNLVVETIEKAPFNPYLDQDNNDIYGV